MISQYNWTELYNCMYIESAEHFYIVLNTFFNECFPDRFPSKTNRPPWFTNALQRLKNLKTNTYKKNSENYRKRARHWELILYIYNHKTKHNATNQIPADIFTYAGTPDNGTQGKKTNLIEKLNEKRHDYEIDTIYRQAHLVKSKTTNPFKKTGTLKKTDKKHFQETNRGRKIFQH